MKKRTLALVLAAVMALSLLAACGQPAGSTPAGSQPASQAAGSTADSGEKPEISVIIFDSGRVPPEKGTYEENDVTEWINENAPVKVRYVAVPRWETRQKYNIMLAAGDAADILMEFDPGMVQEYVNNGSLLPLGDLIDEYGPNIRALTPPEVAAWGVYNGEEYAIPEIRNEIDVPNFMLWIRQDWLDALDLPMPTTTEELLETAIAFATQDPDGNGVADTYGFNITGGEGQIKNIFGARRDTWVPGSDGLLEHASVTENMMLAVGWLKDLYDAGAGDPEFFTDEEKSRSSQDMVNGKTGIYGSGINDVAGFYPTLKKNVPEAEIAPVPLPTSPLGQFGYYSERECGLLNMIPTTCKNPEAAVQFLDWMIAEGWEPVKYGIEGTHYDKEDGVIIPTYTEEVYNLDLAYRRFYAPLANYNITADDLATMYSRTDELSQEARALQAEGVRLGLAIPYVRHTPTDDLGVPLVVEKMPSLREFADNLWTQCIAAGAEMTPEQALEMIRTEWDSQGYQEVKAAFNEAAAALK